MSDIAIIYHSGYGHTEKIAKIIHDAAKEAGADISMVEAAQATKDLDQFDDSKMLVFGSPTYMGSASAGFEAFADASSKKWMAGAWKDKMAAGFTNSGSLSGDKQGTLLRFVILAAQHSMMWVPLGVSNNSENAAGDHGGKPEDINRVGAYLGLMAQSDNADPENTPSSGDIETARLFGKRLAEIIR